MVLLAACEPFITQDDVTCDCAGFEDEELDDLIDAASDVLAILSEGRVTGRCTEIVRPVCSSDFSCLPRSLSDHDPGRYIPLLGPQPLVKGILIDGDPFTEYALVDGVLLARTDGKRWPASQNILAETSEVGTFEIEYERGILPQLARQAAEEIVCSFVRSSPQDTRKAHPNTRGVHIAGVHITLDQMAGEIKRRTFLMPYVTRFLTVYAPGGAAPIVYSPELDDWRLHTVDLAGS